MYFCPFCGTLLLVRGGGRESPLNALTCTNCSYQQPISERMGALTITHSFAEFAKRIPEEEEKEAQEAAAAAAATTATTAAANAPAETRGGGGAAPSASPEVPTAAAEGGQIITMACHNEEAECDSKSAYFVQIQMRSADEPASTFYRCVKCGFQWRED